MLWNVGSYQFSYSRFLDTEHFCSGFSLPSSLASQFSVPTLEWPFGLFEIILLREFGGNYATDFDPLRIVAGTKVVVVVSAPSTFRWRDSGFKFWRQLNNRPYPACDRLSGRSQVGPLGLATRRPAEPLSVFDDLVRRVVV